MTRPRHRDGSGHDRSDFHFPPSAIDGRDPIGEGLPGGRVAVFLDYDGTLTPIVDHPDLARLSGTVRDVLRDLASLCPVAVVSGRDRVNVERLVGLDELFYAGSHGFDISGPGGVRLEHPGARECVPALDAAHRDLQQRLEQVAGVVVERKRFSLAIHYRRVADPDVDSVERSVKEVLAGQRSLEWRPGKKVFEIRPLLEWDKGRAVLWLLQALQLDRSDLTPVYIGDDLTDEDAFRALADRGLTIIVDPPCRPTMAAYSLRDTVEVERFLRRLTERIRGANSKGGPG